MTSSGSGVADEVVLSSEVGCIQDKLEVESIIERGRLRPGQIFLVDLLEGKVKTHATIKRALQKGLVARKNVLLTSRARADHPR